MAALGTVAGDVGFPSPVTRSKPAGASSLKPRHGSEEVAAFFKELFEKVQLERMEALEITTVGDRVVVEGRKREVVRSTGRKYEQDWVMVIAVCGGKIVRNWHYLIRRMYWWRFAGSNNIRSAFLYGFRPA